MINRFGLLLFFSLIFMLYGKAQSIELIVLGIAQDAGAPQISCEKSCCKTRWKSGQKELVSALGVLDKKNKAVYLMDATPDLSEQLAQLHTQFTAPLKGIFLTHAHIGHYTGLMYLGKEALGGKEVPVYAMERMQSFLKQNGPWSQLVKDKNIVLKPLLNEKQLKLSSALQLTPLQVPHRDEYSETVGYRIKGPEKSALFIPDIDKWEIWEKDISEEIAKVDYAFLDATFYDGEELGNRDMQQIPHPFVVESIQRFESLPPVEKAKIYFIHLNHTNPLLNKESDAYKNLIKAGYRVAQTGQIFTL